jgi:hypothetical protein
MAAAFGKFLYSYSTLRTHQRFDRLSIHNFGARIGQPLQQGLIDGDNDPAGIHFPEPNWSIFEKVYGVLPALVCGSVCSR